MTQHYQVHYYVQRRFFIFLNKIQYTLLCNSPELWPKHGQPEGQHILRNKELQFKTWVCSWLCPQNPWEVIIFFYVPLKLKKRKKDSEEVLKFDFSRRTNYEPWLLVCPWGIYVTWEIQALEKKMKYSSYLTWPWVQTGWVPLHVLFGRQVLWETPLSSKGWWQRYWRAIKTSLGP